MLRVSNTQRGNTLLSHLDGTSWTYDDAITADYEIHRDVSILFLSLKFHTCKPEYIIKRIRRLKETRLRIVLVLLDTSNYQLPLRELYGLDTVTIVPCRSFQECALYIKGFNVAGSRARPRERRPAQGEFLACFPGVAGSDAEETLGKGVSLRELICSSREELAQGPGIGDKKAKLLAEYFSKPFSSEK